MAGKARAKKRRAVCRGPARSVTFGGLAGSPVLLALNPIVSQRRFATIGQGSGPLKLLPFARSDSLVRGVGAGRESVASRASFLDEHAAKAGTDPADSRGGVRQSHEAKETSVVLALLAHVETTFRQRGNVSAPREFLPRRSVISIREGRIPC